jgi:signal peptidase I
MIPDPLPSPPVDQQWRRLALDILETLLLSVLLFVGINAISARIQVESVSMRETLDPGDFVLVNKLSYKLGGLGRGDVVVFDPPFESPEPYIKRVIGLPGDEIRISDGQVYVNGDLIQEPYTSGDSRKAGSWTVPADSLFVMGDNRNNSSDSRNWGMLPMDNIIGKAVFVYWPPEQWGALVPVAIAAEAP